MEQISGIAEIEGFWFIVVSEGIEDETETVDMPDGCHQGDQGHSPGHPHTKYSAEEKFSIVPDGLRGKETNAELCRREGIAQSIYYNWATEFMESGKWRLAGDTARAASTREVSALCREALELKVVVAEQTLELWLFKKHNSRRGRRRMRYPAFEKLEIIHRVEQ
jgi:transposase-like protein